MKLSNILSKLDKESADKVKKIVAELNGNLFLQIPSQQLSTITFLNAIEESMKELKEDIKKGNYKKITQVAHMKKGNNIILVEFLGEK